MDVRVGECQDVSLKMVIEVMKCVASLADIWCVSHTVCMFLMVSHSSYLKFVPAHFLPGPV